MSVAATGGPEPDERPRSLGRARTSDVVQAALELLEALPDRPDRLRVSAADVTVDLDWRKPPAALARPAQEAGHPSVVELVETTTATTYAAGPAPQLPDLPDVHYVCSPSVGAFYRASEPGGPPFAEVGAVVSAGQQLGIVEAMKLMLPLEADRSGRVVEVLVEDGQSVEFGQPIMCLEPVT
jgi:acetyl-CoA carboxylase biotin carboxyl carrier protein